MKEFFYDSYEFMLYSAVLGFFLGAVYDLFRILRLSRTVNLDLKGKFYDAFRPKKNFSGKISRILHKKIFKIADGTIIFFEDIIFWIITAAAEILFIFHMNGGEVRIYSLLISAAGFAIYYNSMGRLTSFFAKQIIFFIRCLIYWTFYIIIYPLVKFALATANAACYLYKITAGKIIFAAAEKNKKRYSEKLKDEILRAASRGFTDYKNRRYSEYAET